MVTRGAVPHCHHHGYTLSPQGDHIVATILATHSVFGYNKVLYRGLAKNANRLHLLAAFSNLLIGEKYLLA